MHSMDSLKKMNSFFILWISIVVLQEGSSGESTTSKNLILSKIKRNVITLRYELDLLKLDSEEVRKMVYNLNSTCCHGNNCTITESKGTEIALEEPISNSSRADHVTRLIKAFRDEKLFCRKNMNELLHFQNFLRERIDELETETAALNAGQEKAIENLSAVIHDNTVQFEMTQSRINAIDIRIDKLESELVSVNDGMKRLIANQGSEMNEIRTKIKLFETQNKCDSSWKFNNELNSCFLFISKKRTWDEAVAFCKEKGARLVEIINSCAHAQVKRMFEETCLDWDDRKYSGFWTGGSRKGNQLHAFVWEESKAPVVWTNWYPLEPYSLNQNCLAVMHNDKEFRWDDQGCGLKNPFICEKIITDN